MRGDEITARLQFPETRGPAVAMVVAAFTMAGSLDKCAERMGVSVRTVKRWVKLSPELKAAVDAARRTGAGARGVRGEGRRVK